jgi:hypothetical protein
MRWEKMELLVVDVQVVKWIDGGWGAAALPLLWYSDVLTTLTVTVLLACRWSIWLSFPLEQATAVMFISVLVIICGCQLDFLIWLMILELQWLGFNNLVILLSWFSAEYEYYIYLVWISLN